MNNPRYILKSFEYDVEEFNKDIKTRTVEDYEEIHNLIKYYYKFYGFMKVDANNPDYKSFLEERPNCTYKYIIYHVAKQIGNTDFRAKFR